MLPVNNFRTYTRCSNYCPMASFHKSNILHLHRSLDMMNEEHSPFSYTQQRIPQEPDRGIAKTAMSPLTRAATAATANAGEFPPPNS
ncbi:uncharacterized protein G2W53_031047 [Senna tora]|uniref:Uncharacterized protein n=1 Tax=Senna tora TaxID=362788 RepID=A0A834T889_9FABA|nr:uncharacterized protein G2W53_031047 [Senna tora]